MNCRSKYLMAALPLVCATATADVTKSNNVFTVKLLEYGYPMITTVRVDGADFVPHDNAGADLSMTVRSRAGNLYNPTLGGDCTGSASYLWGQITNWSGSGLGISTSKGIALGVIPRFYNDNAAGTTCQGQGSLSPFNFTWGVTLGDGTNLPHEVMVLDMSFAREDAGDEVVPNISEFPAMFADRDIFDYMYYSYDGDTWYKWEQNGTHDVDNWTTGPNSVNFYKDVQAVWVSNEPDAINNPNSGNGIGIYANGTTTFVTGKRTGQSNNLSYIAAVGDDSSTLEYEDDYWHGWRRLVLVGNLNTVKNSIDSAVSKIGGSGDWTWTDTSSPRFSDY